VLPPIDGASRWSVLTTDAFDGAVLDDAQWEIMTGPPDVAARRRPGVAQRDGSIQLTNCGILMSRGSFAASTERPLRVTAEWTAGSGSDAPTIAVDAAPAPTPTPRLWMTHSIQCTYSLLNPRSGESSLVIMLGYPGQQQMEASFVACPTPEAGGRYRLDVVRYASRVTFWVTRLDGDGWTRAIAANVPAAFQPSAERRVGLMNFDLASPGDVVSRVEQFTLSTWETPGGQ
jgi:hypothetical protein